MTNTNIGDEQLDIRVQSAYDSFMPPEGAQDRVYAALMAAQAGKGHEEAAAPRHARLRLWWIAAPVAACLAIAMVVISLGMGSRDVSMQEAAPVAQQSMSAESESLEESFEADEAENTIAGSAEKSDAPAQIAPFDRVALQSGATYEVGAQLDEEPAYSTLENGVAYKTGESASTNCVVADGRYVQFEGDTAWYALYES